MVREQLADGGEIARSAAIVASWARYAEGVDEDGEPIEIVDRRAEQLTRARARSARSPLAFIRNRELFGDLADDERFAAAYRRGAATHCTSTARARRSRRWPATDVRAVVYDGFGEPPGRDDVPDPAPPSHGAVVRVEATGLCR